MHTLSTRIRRGSLLPFGLTVAASVLVATVVSVGRTDLLVLIAGLALFVVLVWDLRVALPILILVIPLGPKFPLSFGNLYLATAILLVAIAAWFWRHPLLRRPFTLGLDRLTWSLGTLLTVLLVSSLRNASFLITNQANLLRFLQFFMYTGLFLLIMDLPLSRRAAKRLLILLLLVGVAEGVIGAWQWWNKPGFFVVGTFDEAHNNFAVYVIFITMLILGVVLESKKAGTIIAGLVAIGILVYAILFSFSRGGYISIAVATLVFLAMPVAPSRRLAMIAALGAILTFAYVLVPAEVVMRMRSIISNLSGTDIGISFGARLEIWQAAIRDFLANPILGKGTWTYTISDNFFIKVLGEAGILGLVSFLWVIYEILSAEWRMIKQHAQDELIRGIALGLFPATVGCLLVFNLSGDFFVVHRFMGSFWITLALALKCRAEAGG